MRILCVCQSGNVRSVTLARLLRKRGHAVFSVGVKGAWAGEARDQVIALAMWADAIFVQKDAKTGLLSLLPAEADDIHSKINSWRFDVGPDDWKRPDEPHLMNILREQVEEWQESLGQPEVADT